jgi:hypothetical protein
MTRSSYGPLPREITRVLAHLPERVRIVWQDHQLYGAELPVHGWHRIHGQIHLLVTLPDGSRSYFPAVGTALFDAQKSDHAAGMLTVGATRQLRQLVEALQARGRRRRRSHEQRSK